MNEQLQAARERVRQLERAKRRVRELSAETERLTQRVRDFADSVAGEQRDVDRLRELSIQSIWHSLCGDKPEALAEESRELLQARAKHDEAVALLKETERQIRAAKQSTQELASAPDDYERLLVRVEAELKRANDAAGKRLTWIAERTAALYGAEREVGEAYDAARDADAALRIVQDRLQSARNWGALDMWGGDLITTSVKYERIESARTALAVAQSRLRTLGSELGDLARLQTTEIEIEIGSFATFADYVLDGLVVDWFVQSRILAAREQVDATLSEVRRIEGDLHVRRQRLNAELTGLEAERQRWIEGAGPGEERRSDA